MEHRGDFEDFWGMVSDFVRSRSLWSGENNVNVTSAGSPRPGTFGRDVRTSRGSRSAPSARSHATNGQPDPAAAARVRSAPRHGSTLPAPPCPLLTSRGEVKQHLPCPIHLCSDPWSAPHPHAASSTSKVTFRPHHSAGPPAVQHSSSAPSALAALVAVVPVRSS